MRYTNRFLTGRRALAVAAAGALTLTLVPGMASADLHEDVCTDEAGEEFPDVEESDFWEDEIECIAGYGIVDGFTDGEYKAARTVTRAQMAKYMAATYETATDSTITPSQDYFDDDDGHPLEEWINKAAEIGVVEGFDTGDYMPNLDVDRAEMAAYVSRMIEAALGIEDIDEGDTDHFTDDNASGFEEEINELASIGVVEGTSPDTSTYEPVREVFRGEMAGFTARAAGYLDDQGAWAPSQPTTNQTFTVTSDEEGEATNTVVPQSDEPDSSDDRTYTVDGLDDETTYDIELMRAEEVDTDEDGTVTFADTDDNDVADSSDTSAEVTVVNGSAVADSSDGTDENDGAEAQPVNGTLTFTVDSDSREQIVPVVFNDDGATDDELDLDADNAPTEDFGIGGQKNWVPAEAGDGAFEVNVVQVDKDGDTFIGEDENITTGPADTGGDPSVEGTFEYDSNDNYTVDGLPATMSTFEENLSEGDAVGGTYVQDDGASSTFNLDDRAPSVPQNVTATEDSASEITVTWDDPATGSPDSFNVYRNDEACADTDAAELSQVGTVDGSADNEFQDSGLTDDTTYCYSVTAVDQGDESDVSGNAGDAQTDEATTLTTGATVSPESTDAYVATDTNDELDDGDVFRVVFDEPLEAIQTDDRIQLTDEDGELVNLYCGGTGAGTDQDSEVDCSLNPGAVTIGGNESDANEVLTVTLVGEDYSPDNSVSGGDGAIDYPATITDQDGIADQDGGNAWTPTDDPDNVVDDEGTKTESGNFGSALPEALNASTADNDSSDTFTAGDAITVEYDEEMVFSDGDTIDVTDQNAGGATESFQLVLAASCDGDTSTADATHTGSGTNTLVATLCSGDYNSAEIDADQNGGPAIMTAASGIDDGQGNVWDPTNPAGQDQTLGSPAV